MITSSFSVFKTPLDASPSTPLVSTKFFREFVQFPRARMWNLVSPSCGAEDNEKGCQQEIDKEKEKRLEISYGNQISGLQGT
jgi:hypothetical protein